MKVPVHCFWYASCLLIALTTRIFADEPAPQSGIPTPQELCTAYKTAVNYGNWKQLYGISTKAYQDAFIFECALLGASSKDHPLQNLLDKHRIDWKPFAREWTDAEVEKLWKESPTIAGRIGAEVVDRETFFSDGHEMLRRMGNRSPTVVQQIKDLTQNGPRAECDVIESYVLQGETRHVLLTEHLYFIKVGSSWYLAAGHELAPPKENGRGVEHKMPPGTPKE